MSVTAQSIITAVKNNYARGVGRTTIMSCLNRAVNILFSHDTAQATFYNTSDDEFPFPILSTTAGQLEYELTIANLVDSDGDAVALEVNGTTVALRRAKQVFIDGGIATNSGYNSKFRGGPFYLTGTSSYSSRRYEAQYYKVVGQPFDKTNNQAAKWIFDEDPGTHTDLYYVEAYFEHPEIENEDDTLLIDAVQWEQALIDGTVGFIEDFQNGRSERLNRFYTYWVKRFTNSQTEGYEKRRPNQFPMRECG